MVSALAGAGALACLLYRYWDDPIAMKVKLPKGLPRPSSSLPILGDAVTMLANLHRLEDWLLEVTEAHPGRTIAIKLPFDEPILLTNDPVNVEHILKTRFDVYEKGPHVRVRCQDVLGDGIFNADGENWRRQRKTAAMIFNVKNFKDFVGVVFAEELVQFEKRLDSFAGLDGGKAGIIDLHDAFYRFTLDGFSKIGFGIDLGGMNAKAPLPFCVAFDAAQGRMQSLEEFLNPFDSHRKNVKTIREFGHNIIKERRANGNFDGNDLLSLLANVKDDEGNLPSDDFLAEQVLNFIIAGRDTTAQALSWSFWLLHRHPATLAALREEIDATLGARSVPTYEEVKSMKYANAVFKEALRLYPSVPNETKQANADDVLPDGTIVPKGAMVMWIPYVMGRLEAIWGPDAKTFRPERWLEMSKQPSPFDYPVFNAGPRVCLGKSMAELEGVFVMVSTLRSYEFEIVNSDKVTYANSLTLPMKGGLLATVKRRF